MPGQTERFGKYHVLERIAQGGMAEVYKVKTVGIAGFEKVQALKRILPALAREPRFIRSFVDEARIAVELNHRNIVQVFDFGKAGGELFLSMELIDGVDLRTAVDQAARQDVRLPLPVACYILGEIASGLDYAHRKTDVHGQVLGIVHCDVSPQNIMLSYEGSVKVLDFGVARARISTRQWSRRLRGKPRYMAPEQTLGDMPTAATDVFSLGIIAWELLTGLPLFEGEDLPGVLEAVRRADAPRLDRLDPDVPAHLADAVARALSLEPRARGTAADLAAIMSRAAQIMTPRASARSLAQWLATLYPQASAPLQAPGPDAPPRPAARAAPRHDHDDVGPTRTLDRDRPDTFVSDVEPDWPEISTFQGTTTLVIEDPVDESFDDEPSQRLLEKRRVVVTVVLVDGGAETARRELTRLLSDLAYKRGAVLHGQGEDSLVAVFGLDVAGEDDVARAMSYALGAVEATREASAAAGGDLAMRVAARAGVVAMPDERGGYRLIGDAIEETRELARGAEPGRPLLGGDAGRLTSTYYAFRELPARRHRRRRVRVLELLGPQSFDERERALQARAGRFFGRHLELAQLTAALGRTITENRRLLLALVGPPGVGKSRLLAEFVSRARATARAGRPRVVAVAATPGSKAMPFALTIELLQAVLNLPPDRGEAARSRLAQRMRHVLRSAGLHAPGAAIPGVAGQATGADEIIAALEMSMELRDGALIMPLHKSADLRARVIAALHALRVVLVPPDRLLITILEDLQFADATSVDILRETIAAWSQGPGLVIFTSDDDAQHTASLAEWVDQVIQLDDLAGDDLAQLARDRLADSATPERVAAIVQRAGGSPLLVEQLAMEARDVGEIPPTARAVITARVDRLGDAAKAVLQHAAVIGRRLRARILEELMGREIAAELAELCEESFLRRDDGASTESPEGELAFTAELIREVVYDSLSASARRDTHARLGQLLAARQRARRDEPPATIAQHLELGGDLAQASTYWLRAGLVALAAGDAAAAAERFGRALAIDDASGDRASRASRARQRRALAGRERALRQLGDHEAQARDLERLEIMARSEPQLMADVKNRAAMLRLRLGDLDAAVTASEEAEHAARRSGDQRSLGEALRIRGEAYERRGELEQALDMARKAHELFRRIGAVDQETEALIGISRSHLARARYHDARAGCAAILERVREGDNPWVERVVRHQVAVIQLCLGELEDAMTSARHAVEICQRHGDHAREGDSLSVCGLILRELGCHDEARAHFSRALAILERTGSRWSRADCLVHAGVTEAHLGDHDRGVGYLREASALAREIGARYVRASALAALAGVTLLGGHEDDVPLARRAAERAADIAHQATFVGLEIQGISRLAMATFRAGELGPALSLSTRAVELLEAQRHIEGPEQEVFFAHHQLLVAAGDPGAPAALERARAEVERKLASLTTPAWRRSFVTDVAVNAAILAAAQAP